MANHITNILKASPSVLVALEGENPVDFNSIIPMPESLRRVEVNGAENLVQLINGNLNLSSDQLLSKLTLSNVMRDIQDKRIPQWNEKQFENFITMLRNYREYGYTSWLDFANDKWGTKWNAYDIEEREGGVKFETAWCPPHPVIKKLVSLFPNERIKHEWADEDIGNNLGSRVYYQEGMTEASVDDPVDFALSLNERDREYYRLNPDTGKWEYDESKDQS